jgi:preprotein translocase subunit YajC
MILFAKSKGSSGGLGFLIVLVGLFAIMWIFLIRPQRRRRTAQSDLLSQIEVGDEIVTVGGVYGTVRSVADDELTVEIAPGTNVRLDRRAVAAIVPDDEPTQEHGELAEGHESKADES